MPYVEAIVSDAGDPNAAKTLVDLVYRKTAVLTLAV
jgi:hypothetical protein